MLEEATDDDVMFWLDEVAACAELLFGNAEAAAEMEAEVALWEAEEAAELKKENEAFALAEAAAQRALDNEMAGAGDIEVRLAANLELLDA
jgi:hypothetical protein